MSAERSRRVHALTCWPAPFQAIVDGEKTYEIRIDDRGYAVGDYLELNEYEPGGPYGGRYTDRKITMRVTDMTPGGAWGLPAHLCVLSIRRAP